MPEARVDPLSGLRTLIADDRDGRPGARPAAAPPAELGADDPFAEGNEHLTPPECWADRPGGGRADSVGLDGAAGSDGSVGADGASAPDSPGWRLRAVPNKYPALSQSFDAPAPADRMGLDVGMPELLVASEASGVHEVLINSPRAVRSLVELGPGEIDTLTAGWAARIEAHNTSAAYVHVCVNERIEAGASIAHSHSQIFALPFVPAPVARERERMRAYYEHTQGRVLLEDLLIEEVRSGQRLVAIDDDAALIAPFASFSPYRLTIIPRRPAGSFEASAHRGSGMLYAAMQALGRVLEPSHAYGPPLNLWVRTAPDESAGYCWRIEIAPRLGQPAGFELGTGSAICSVAPERAAAELREALG